MRLGALNPEEPFSGVTMPVEIVEDEPRVQSVIESSRENYATKYESLETKPITRNYEKTSITKPSKQIYSTLP